MMTSMLNHYKQWWIVNDINGSLSQLILLDEQVREIERINSDGLNVTLVDRDKIAFLNDLVHIFITITHAQILYQCNFDNNTLANLCLKPEQLAGLLISEQLGSAGIQPPISPLSDVTSSLKPTTNGQSCSLPYKINSFTWDMYFCNEGYCQTSTDSTSKCPSGQFGYFNFQAPRKVSFSLNTDSGGIEQSITVRKQEVGDISETIDTITRSPYNGWIKRQVSFHTSKGGYKIYFDFERISGPSGPTTIIAIDEISVHQGNCPNEPVTQSTSEIAVGTTTSITTITESDLTTIGITSISTPITTTTATTTTTTTTTSTITSTTFSSTTTSTTSTATTTTTSTTSTTIIISITTTTTTSTSIQTTTSTISISSTAKTTAVTLPTATTSLSTHFIVITTTVMTNQPSSTTMITNFTSNSTVSATPSVKVYIIVLATVIPIGTVAIVILILWLKKPIPFKKSKVNVLEMNQVTPAPT
ncbi:unnamed protein product [Adineta steineri]|uniref:MAM domain-containing protein n=1 Tax=Adineta steineri TaxID=433720 RepID=A0A819NYR8_9BILA|nr:unnamed protein product [Adineta steineri]